MFLRRDGFADKRYLFYFFPLPTHKPSEKTRSELGHHHTSPDRVVIDRTALPVVKTLASFVRVCYLATNLTKNGTCSNAAVGEMDTVIIPFPVRFGSVPVCIYWQSTHTVQCIKCSYSLLARYCHTYPARYGAVPVSSPMPSGLIGFECL